MNEPTPVDPEPGPDRDRSAGGVTAEPTCSRCRQAATLIESVGRFLVPIVRPDGETDFLCSRCLRRPRSSARRTGGDDRPSGSARPRPDRPPWSEAEADRARPLAFWSSCWADFRAYSGEAWEGWSRPKRLRRWATDLLAEGGLQLLAWYRLAHTLRHRGGLPGRVVARLVVGWIGLVYRSPIAATARLHGGVVLPHPQNIVIAPGVVVGPESWIFHNVTLGGLPGRVGTPTIGRDVRIYTGSVVAGPLRIGDEVVIGALTVVSRDVPSRSIVLPHPPDVDPIGG